MRSFRLIRIGVWVILKALSSRDRPGLNMRVFQLSCLGKDPFHEYHNYAAVDP